MLLILLPSSVLLSCQILLLLVIAARSIATVVIVSATRANHLVKCLFLWLMAVDEGSSGVSSSCYILTRHHLLELLS